ncbi:MAG TPA: DUF1800 domain-containing protein [Stellaceae bacterium]|nr:DUF1800 domain-containing protein [Stellaceae bacterium]
MTDAAALIAATRFGFAAEGGDLAAIGRDPRRWALAQLHRRPASLPGDLPPSSRVVAQLLEARRERKEKTGDPKAAKDEMRDLYIAEVGARLNAAIASDAPLLERLVFFWSNHFTVSALRPAVRGFVGAFEREAIRPHVTGRFADMLLAVTRHPAMCFYLDNVVSIGPNSPFGRRKDKGLNENLGRELLELHTLGVDGGYTQQDVEALARILTGWTIARLRDPNPGTFRFAPGIHEPGPKVLLGKTYPEAGVEEGEAALRDLARHPATARHIATKLARHFIADAPPQPAIERIAKVFRDSDGDLREVTAAVINDPEAWRQPFAKVRTPTELVIAAFRASGVREVPALPLVASLRTLDQPAFVAPSPAGWPDVASAWVSPESVLRRAEWCQTFAERLPNPPDPVAMAEASYGELLPAETLEAIRRAPSRRVGLALLLASPEFQRR